jgi:uncharacterized membrane protein (UPF0127 family)
VRPWLPTILLTLAACSSNTASDASSDAASDVSSNVSSDIAAAGDDPGAGVSPTTDGNDTAPATTNPATASVDAVTPEGFEAVAATITSDTGEVCDVCLWLADTNDLRARGLMFVTDLGGADGMAFRYPAPHTGTFWMRNTVTPLSIAFFAADGAFLDAFDMEPCTTEPCLQYATPRDFTVAIEVVQGDLGEIGAAAGSRLELSDLPCDPGG